MTEQEARAVARQARHDHQVPPGAVITTASQRFIELTQGVPTEPAPVRDALAWIVRFQQGIAWVDLAIEDRTGQVVRVERSR